MIEVWKITIPKLTGDEPRRAYIYLPKQYEYDKDARFPVLYMFDGHNLFFDSHATYGKSWGLKEYMDYTELPFIIVGIECNHDPDHGRLKEYSPYDFTERSYGKIPGWGETTMNWFAYSLKPDIDRDYRTLPDRDHTFIAGSSMGGLMSVYALLKYNHIYSRAAALSPSLWVNPKAVEKLIQTSPLQENTILYMDYGSEEMKNHTAMLRKYNRAVRLLTERGVFVTSRIIPWGTHCEASWERQLPFVMETLAYGLFDEDQENNESDPDAGFDHSQDDDVYYEYDI